MSELLYAEGPKHCNICFIGEAPADEEIATGKPFKGNAGRLFDTLLAGAGINRQECYVTNVLKFRLPSMKINNRLTHNVLRPHLSFYRGKAKVSDEFKKAMEELREELAECTANVFVCLGSAAAYAMTGTTAVTKWRGSILESTLLPGRKCLVTIHPAAALKKKAKGSSFDPYNYRHYITYDLQKALRESTFNQIRRKDRTYRIYPSFEESLAYMDYILKSSLTVGFDIETPKQQLGCFSLSISDTDAICVNFFERGQHKFDPDQESQLLMKLDEILWSDRVTKIIQNSDFESFMLFHYYGMQIRNFEDTMIAQAIMTPEFDMNLGFLTSIYTDEPYYKDEGGKHNEIPDEEAYFRYNCKDSLVLHEIWPKQKRDLIRQENLETYHYQKMLVPILTYMESRGTRINRELLEETKSRVKESLEKLVKEFQKVCSQVSPEYENINPNSSKQLIKYFYIDKNNKPIMKGDSLTTDEKALKKLAQKGNPEASLLLKIRNKSKLISTYLNIQYDEDGRLRCDYVPCRAVSYTGGREISGSKQGRLASSKTIFGTGMNMQNLPQAFRGFLVSDYGKEDGECS